nr:MAG TPA: hypothetical protein [Caudoviricetes sp.]
MDRIYHKFYLYSWHFCLCRFNVTARGIRSLQ